MPRARAGAAKPRAHRDHARRAGTDAIPALRTTVQNLGARFAGVVREQRVLGFKETEGLTAELGTTSNAVETIIHQDLSWVAQFDIGKLLASLSSMRRYEIEYRLTYAPAAEHRFLDEIRNFNDLFESVDGAPPMKRRLNETVQAYNSAFAQWVATTSKIEPLLALIAGDAERLVPAADRIAETAQSSASEAETALAASRAQIRNFILSMGCAAAADRHRIELADRPQHHPAARSPCRGDEAAGERRHRGGHSRDPGARRTRRHGARGHRLPRHHDRARPARRASKPRRARRASSAARRSRR